MRKHFFVLQRKTTGKFVGKNSREVSELDKAVYFDTENYAKEVRRIEFGGNANRYYVRKVRCHYELELEEKQ